MGVFEQFPYTNFHDMNLDWIIQLTKAGSEAIAMHQIEVNAKLQEIAAAVEDKESAERVAQMIASLNAQISAIKNDTTIQDLYKKTADAFNKTQTIIDNAVNNLGSVAQWAIVDDCLVATIYNESLIVDFNMDNDGRLEVIANV